MKKGLVYVFTGEGKGKTSAAIGTAVRAVGNGMAVAWVGFYKQESWKSSEVGVLRKLGIKLSLMGKGFFIKEETRAVHMSAAKRALEEAKKVKADLLILDEVGNAVGDGLIDPIDLIELISKRGKTHLILTGRGVSKELIKVADLVTEMKKIKHPYDTGKLAVKGLDF